MSAPSERTNESLPTLVAGSAEGPEPDHEPGEDSAAYQRVEALFDLLRRPATFIEACADDDLAPGKVLGEFEVVRPLASGGMGRVYLARQLSLGRLVALKVCKPEVARDSRMKVCTLRWST
jgi:serine/threonine protein kinase